MQCKRSFVYRIAFETANKKNKIKKENKTELNELN